MQRCIEVGAGGRGSPKELLRSMSNAFLFASGATPRSQKGKCFGVERRVSAVSPPLEKSTAQSNLLWQWQHVPLSTKGPWEREKWLGERGCAVIRAGGEQTLQLFTSIVSFV